MLYCGKVESSFKLLDFVGQLFASLLILLISYSESDLQTKERTLVEF